MAQRETTHLKALYFDFRIKGLKAHYSQTNPKEAYALVQRFLTSHNFSHEQYSGYYSKHKTTDLEIFDLIREMSNAFPWLQYCINHFEVTNVGVNHDLMDLFVGEIEAPTF